MTGGRFEPVLADIVQPGAWLDKADVVVSPGASYGDAGEGFIRISFAAPVDTIGVGIERVGRWLRAAGR